MTIYQRLSRAFVVAGCSPTVSAGHVRGKDTSNPISPATRRAKIWGLKGEKKVKRCFALVCFALFFFFLLGWLNLYKKKPLCSKSSRLLPGLLGGSRELTQHGPEGCAAGCVISFVVRHCLSLPLNTCEKGKIPPYDRTFPEAALCFPSCSQRQSELEDFTCSGAFL